MTSFLITTGSTQTSRLDMGGADDLTVQAGGALSVSANQQSVRFQVATSGAIIYNLGLIENLGSGRAIRFETGVGSTLNATINNFNTIGSSDDAIQIQAGAVTAGLLTINNAGLLTSAGNEALDFAGATGAFTASVTNSGDLLALFSDAIRFGAIGNVVNTGTINGGSGDGYAGNVDGIQYADNSSGTVQNNAGTISGDRHGINAGVGTTVTVTNLAGASITGRNGSGVGSDGTASVTNYGTITGAFSDSPGSDRNGPGGEVPDGTNDGDGDGIDIDGQATIVNFGTIQGTGASGHGSDGLPNTSEGIAAGGGSITNHTGGIIQGVGLGILVDDSSQGNAPFVTTIVNDGTISGGTSFAIRIISNLDDTITNRGTISGAGGTAIQFGTGNNTLFIGTGSSITGLSDGGTGTDLLDYSAFGSGISVDLFAGTATGTGGVTGFENVIGSNAADTITGSIDNNILAGGEGDDTINGGGGVDTVFGGDGEDTIIAVGGGGTYYGDGDNDTMNSGLAGGFMFGGAGIDTIDHSSFNGDYTFDMGTGLTNFGGESYQEFENVVMGNGTNTVTGTNVANRMTGGTGSDTFDGLGGADVLSGGDGGDNLNGGAGNDTLNGGTGSDTMEGGADNDTYIVDDAGDQTIEAIGGGTDTVRAWVSWTLADNIERLQLLGGANNSATGNTLGNDLYGNTGNNVLNGRAGADRMEGFGGNDSYFVDVLTDRTIEEVGGGIDTVRSWISWTLGANLERLELLGTTQNYSATGNIEDNDLFGNNGNNVLDGRAGTDRMEGRGGNDNYIIDNAGDQTIEAIGGGTDTVRSWLSWTLADNVERLQLLGGANNNATGNTLDNELFGNAGKNVLNGRAGADRMEGFGGNDGYFVDVTGDQVIEAVGGGTDTVRAWITWTLGANLERLQLLGTTQSLNGAGNELNNEIFGNAGNNRLAGWAGNDTLTGGAGLDTFIFNTALNAANNVDTITDFSVADDVIRLDDAIFTAIGPLGTLAAAAFTIGAAATTAAHRIVYNSATGALIYDSNGSAAGGATQFAVIGTGLALTNADFLIA